MAVRIVKHTPRCKLCAHAKAPEINELLERRSKREKDEAGETINLDYVLARFAEWGVENPNADNVKGHVRKHIEFLADETVEQEQAQVQEIVAALANGQMEFADLDEGLKFLATVYLEQQQRKYAAGQDLGITHDHFLKLVAEATKRKHNDVQDRLLEALGGGIGQVFQKALGPAIDAIPALPEAGAEAAEVIAVADGD